MYHVCTLGPATWLHAQVCFLAGSGLRATPPPTSNVISLGVYQAFSSQLPGQARKPGEWVRSSNNTIGGPALSFSTCWRQECAILKSFEAHQRTPGHQDPISHTLCVKWRTLAYPTPDSRVLQVVWLLLLRPSPYLKHTHFTFLGAHRFLPGTMLVSILSSPATLLWHPICPEANVVLVAL